MNDENILDHQDWRKIVINIKEKKKTNNTNVSVKKITSTNIDTNLDKKINDGDLKHNKFSKEFCLNLIKKRNELKLTQKQMANQLNISLQIISDIEKCKCNYDHKLNNKIKRIYNI